LLGLHTTARLAAVRAGQTSVSWLGRKFICTAKLQKMIRITNDDKPYSSALLRQADVGGSFRSLKKHVPIIRI